VSIDSIDSTETEYDVPRNSDYYFYNDNLAYYPDYSNELRDRAATGILSLEYERHIERSFSLNETHLDIYEYDSEEWAEFGFSYNLNSILEDNYYSSIDRHESEGYYFVFYDDYYDHYEVYYLVGNCIIHYSFSLNNGTDVMHTTYMNICDELGLPISSEMVAEILG
jgi:hypothetical protein